MSLSVEELREIEQNLARSIKMSEAMARSALDPYRAFSRANSEFKQLLAIRELIAIKEAKPVAYIVEADNKFLSWDGPIEGGNLRTPLIRKPE